LVGRRRPHSEEAALVDAAQAHRQWQPLSVRAKDITEAPQNADWGEERTIRAQVLDQLLTGQGGPGVVGTDWEIAPRAGWCSRGRLLQDRVHSV
jgi:hypothetical protein